ncbi:hypothetical protein V8E54_011362 [Elaphomyces granulatus]
MASLEHRQRQSSDPVGCPDMVQEMMDEFMVRGTNCPMQRVALGSQRMTSIEVPHLIPFAYVNYKDTESPQTGPSLCWNTFSRVKKAQKEP